MRRVSPIHPKSRQTMKQKKTSKTDYDGDGRAKLGYCQRSQAINRSRFFFYGVFLRSGRILTQRHANKRNRDDIDLIEITYENMLSQTRAKDRKITVSNYESPALTESIRNRSQKNTRSAHANMPARISNRKGKFGRVESNSVLISVASKIMESTDSYQ